MHLLSLVQLDPIDTALLLLESLDHRLILILNPLKGAHSLSEIQTVDFLRHGEHLRSV